MAVGALAAVVIRRFVAGVAGLAVGQASMVHLDGGPVGGGDVATGALAAIVIGRLVLIVALLAVHQIAVVHAVGRPVAGGEVTVGALAGVVLFGSVRPVAGLAVVGVEGEVVEVDLQEVVSGVAVGAVRFQHAVLGRVRVGVAVLAQARGAPVDAARVAALAGGRGVRALQREEVVAADAVREGHRARFHHAACGRAVRRLRGGYGHLLPGQGQKVGRAAGLEQGQAAHAVQPGGHLLGRGAGGQAGHDADCAARQGQQPGAGGGQFVGGERAHGAQDHLQAGVEGGQGGWLLLAPGQGGQVVKVTLRQVERQRSARGRAQADRQPRLLQPLLEREQ